MMLKNVILYSATIIASLSALLSPSLAQELKLDAAVANDLRTRCQKWQASLTKLLADLDSGRPVVEVREETNPLVDKLVKVLSELG